MVYLHCMSHKPFLSVILPTHNHRTHIAERLIDLHQHLRQQPYASEIIVADNASSDDTVAIVERLQIIVPNLQVIRHDLQRSLGQLAQHGLLLAHGVWRVILDPTRTTPIIEFNKVLPYAAVGHQLFTTRDHSLWCCSASVAEKLCAQPEMSRRHSYSALVRYAVAQEGRVKFIATKTPDEHFLLDWMNGMWYSLHTNETLFNC